MTTCKTCKYWNTVDYPGDGSSLAKNMVKECRYVEEFWGVRDWRKDEATGDWVDVLTSDRKAFVQDGSDYAAVLLTTADFGCNQYAEEGLP